jgi:hypothetical protein
MSTQIELLVGRKWRDEAISEALSEALNGMPIPEPEAIGDESYIELPEVGVSMVLPDGETIFAIHLHCEGHEGYSQYTGNTPVDIAFDMSRKLVREYLGHPTEHGDEGHIMLLGYRPAWDAFNVSGKRLHIEYAEDGQSIRLMTISALEM